MQQNLARSVTGEMRRRGIPVAVDILPPKEKGEVRLKVKIQMGIETAVPAYIIDRDDEEANEQFMSDLVTNLSGDLASAMREAVDQLLKPPIANGDDSLDDS